MTDELFDAINITILGVSAMCITGQINSIVAFMLGAYSHTFLQSIRAKIDKKLAMSIVRSVDKS